MYESKICFCYAAGLWNVFTWGTNILSWFKIIESREWHLSLTKKKYLNHILKKYGMENCKEVCTPMVTMCNLISHDDSSIVNRPEYRSMIESLLYLTRTRPDIMHAIGIVGQFQDNPRESHLQISTRNWRFLSMVSKECWSYS